MYKLEPTGWDAFDLKKSPEGAPNRFIERLNEAMPERRHDNTIPYDDPAPKSVE